MRKKIAIDFDEVIYDFMSNLILFVNKKYKKNIKYEEIISFNFWENGIGKDKEEAVEIVNEYVFGNYYDPHVYIERSLESLMELEKKYKIYIITARPDEFKEKTKMFFEKNLPELEYEIIFTGKFVKESKSKGEICKEIGVDIFVEDNFEYAKSASDLGVRTFLITRPWNQGKEDDKIIRVDNWSELMRCLDEY
jgi:uncharacterized HAD superfamily protein